MSFSRPANPTGFSFRRLFRRLVFLTMLGASLRPATSDETEAKANQDSPPQEVIPEGHSEHGDAFNEGPRQAAYLMSGVGKISFDVTTESDQARAFVVQGVAQLHGFWYLESERSFRQAATLDPDCAIAYWGMAMSNRRNEDRARGFIREAVDRKKKAGKREQLYIEAFSDYINAKSETTDEKRKRAEKYALALDDLLIEFPDDLNAKAFLCEFFWSARRKGVKLPGYSAVDAMIQDVLDAEPLHPIHHYRIHLWDSKKPELALESAARCGLSAPSIAHMWHMPGHIYSRLKRYHDAVYQQEASARVDHAHMIKDLVLPDQIHNFAHNNEWCIRNLVHIGRVSDAIDLARNMIELPRHPKYNHIGRSGSYKYGRQRLLDVLRTYQLHEQLASLAETPYLEESGDAKEDLKRDRYVAAALIVAGQKEKGMAIRQRIEEQLEAEKKKRTDAGNKAEADAKEKKKDEKEVKKARSTAEGKFRSQISNLEKALQEIDGRLAVTDGAPEKALELFKKAGSVPVEEQVALMLEAGKTDEAVKKIEEHVRSNRNEVRPLAAQVEVLWAAGKKEEAGRAFETLQKLSSDIDKSIPAFNRLDVVAEELGLTREWTKPAEPAADIGARPPLDALGPFRWTPVAAPEWTLPDVDNKPRSLAAYRGRSVVVIFYLGAGCLHCAEQLQKFAPETEAFREAGLDIVAISTDKQDTLNRAAEDLEDGMPFPLVSDSELNIFKKYRCYDDFEQQTLHGTFLVDPDGRIRWQDISFEPFMDPDFVLKEAKRLLGQDRHQSYTDTPSITAAD